MYFDPPSFPSSFSSTCSVAPFPRQACQRQPGTRQTPPAPGVTAQTLGAARAHGQRPCPQPGSPYGPLPRRGLVSAGKRPCSRSWFQRQPRGDLPRRLRLTPPGTDSGEAGLSPACEGGLWARPGGRALQPPPLTSLPLLFLFPDLRSLPLSWALGLPICAHRRTCPGSSRNILCK